MTKTQDYSNAIDVIILIIMAFAIALLSVAMAVFGFPAPPPRPIPIEVIGRVVNGDSGEVITGARVTIEVDGSANLSFTDVEGIFGFSLLASNEPRPARVWVDAIGYQTYNETLTIDQQYQIPDIRLLPTGVPTATGSAQLFDLNEKGQEAYKREQYEDALNYYQQALLVARRIEDRAGEESTLTNIGRVYYRQELYEDALQSYQEALEIAREVGNRTAEATTLTNIGRVYHRKGSYEQALDSYQQAWLIAREIDDPFLQETILNDIDNLRPEGSLQRPSGEIAPTR
ncbi:MAG: tetratricopeptide repeat protein [Ardenticatenaceae bacterium]